MENFILNYSKEEKTIVIYNDIIYHSEIKPKLSFSYQTLYCESPTEVYFYFEGDIQYPLTKEQIEECYQFAKNYVENGDYNVYAYDPNDNNNYKGFILKSEAKNKNYNWTYTHPENEASFWNENKKQWIEYYAALTEDGELYTDINSICNNCVCLFTKKEYDKFPKPEHNIDTWDFIQEKWVDKRNLNNLKYVYKLEIRNLFEGVRWKIMDEYVPQYEQDMWRIQIEEAKAFINDNNAKTPYIDTFLKNREDKIIPSKIELINDILKNSENYIINMAKVNAKQWTFMKNLQSCKNGYDCDDLLKSVKEYCSSYLKGVDI